MTIDHDPVLRARAVLLGSGRPSRAELVGAYRVLAEVSPRAYRPRLVDALLELRYDSRDPQVDLALAAEAVRAARGTPAGEPNRAGRLRQALDAHQASLFALGRRAEGLAVCAELAEAGRSAPLASALAEEGRFGEAAEVDEEAARTGNPDTSFWEAVRRAANLEAAGRYDAASAVLGEHLRKTRRKTDGRRTLRAILTWELVHLSRVREAAGDRAGAADARREALGVLEQLAATGEAGNPSCILSWWRSLFLLSGRAAEPAPSRAAPMPPFGAEFGWSRQAREGFLGMLPDLEAEAARLREAGRLPELADVRRRIVMRAAVREGDRPHRFGERFAPYFDEGVALARCLPGSPARLARALTDRAMFLVAARTYAPAYADFAERVALDAPAGGGFS
ncbi:hypothetical protein [Streptomyces sp. NPDC021224]|uniref:hypothetical protein n=1 Tax=unclassified Streptomyces TaxID=2593676 RepID=UPI0037AC9DA8